MKNLYLTISIFILAFIYPVIAFAQEVAGPDIFDKILALIPGEGKGILVIAGAVELGLRLFKTEKPLSIIHLAAKTLHKVSAIAEKLADLIDKVLPQRTK